ncbi:hypothetical protein [Kineosporia succinea]|uniref:Uncharacterized protein n=1 Tax=Kineosporia succinea TaxID=84632 RepID=A0ABT9NXU8_9ACTN|nr:hypothetical protein [Kineosporia succinea]MDP9825251.1 hypothetical protein [Kineosporia succinea]
MTRLDRLVIGAEAPTLAVHLRPTLNGAAEREHAREIAANLDGVTEAEFAVASGSRSVLLLRLRTP